MQVKDTVENRTRIMKFGIEMGGLPPIYYIMDMRFPSGIARQRVMLTFDNYARTIDPKQRVDNAFKWFMRNRPCERNTIDIKGEIPGLTDEVKERI